MEADKKLMKLSLILIIFLSIPMIWAQAPKAGKLCVVISGSKKDDNGFLDEELFKGGKKIAGVDCKVFGNWADAKAFAYKNLAKDGKLMIIQGAHGFNNGSYEVNDGPLISAESIHKDLKELSATFHVGSVIHSCYSAQIMNLKLLDDEASNSNLDKLCLVSSSSFGRITYSNPNDIIQNLLKLQPGESLERPFINNRSGVISSAAWSEVGLPQYLMSKKTSEGLRALEKMESIMNGEVCTDNSNIVAQICLAPSITDETFEDVVAYLDPVVPGNEKGRFEKEFYASISRLVNELSKEPSNQVVKDELVCRKEILKSYQARFGEKLKKLKTYPDVIKLKSDILAMPFYKTHCSSYLKTLNKGDWFQTGLVTDTFTDGINGYVSSLDRLDRKYADKKLGGEFQMQKFLLDAIDEKPTCSTDLNSKEKIIQSLFGVEFFQDEYVSNYENTLNRPNELLNSRKISTEQVLKGFQNSALLKTSLSNAKDQQRRKACQNFKF